MGGGDRGGSAPAFLMPQNARGLSSRPHLLTVLFPPPLGPWSGARKAKGDTLAPRDPARGGAPGSRHSSESPVRAAPVVQMWRCPPGVSGCPGVCRWDGDSGGVGSWLRAMPTCGHPELGVAHWPWRLCVSSCLGRVPTGAPASVLAHWGHHRCPLPPQGHVLSQLVVWSAPQHPLTHRPLPPPTPPNTASRPNSG